MKFQPDQNRLIKDVEFLTSIFPFRNYKNIESLRKAAAYIKKEFEKTGLHTEIQTWEADGNIYENVIASYLPEQKLRFIVGAHYDVYKDQPGADDNASGVAGLIELARLFSESGIAPDYGIDFVSYCLEEPPFFRKKEMGSYVHSESVHSAGKEIIGMISIEMIGYYGEKQNRSADHENFLVISGIKKFEAFNSKLTALLREADEMIIRKVSYADDAKNNGPSDHRNYWKFDYPGVMLIGTSKEKNPNYHKDSDTIETLDFEVMSKAVRTIANAVFNF